MNRNSKGQFVKGSISGTPFKKGNKPWNYKGLPERIGKWWLIKNCPKCGKLISNRGTMCKSCSHKKENGFVPHIWTEKQKRKNSLSHQGKLGGFTGYKHSEETKLKLSNQRIGIKHPERSGYNNSSKRPEVRAKMSLSRKGRKLTAEWKEKIKRTCIERKINNGNKNGQWKGGISSLHILIRKTLQSWNEQVLQRDNYTCQKCNKQGNVEAHHKRHFSELFKEFLLIYSFLSPINDKDRLLELSKTYLPFLDINNGITLCLDCHKPLHKSYNFKLKGGS